MNVSALEVLQAFSIFWGGLILLSFAGGVLAWGAIYLMELIYKLTDTERP